MTLNLCVLYRVVRVPTELDSAIPVGSLSESRAVLNDSRMKSSKVVKRHRERAAFRENGERTNVRQLYRRARHGRKHPVRTVEHEVVIGYD